VCDRVLSGNEVLDHACAVYRKLASHVQGRVPALGRRAGECVSGQKPALRAGWRGKGHNQSLTVPRVGQTSRSEIMGQDSFYTQMDITAIPGMHKSAWIYHKNRRLTKFNLSRLNNVSYAKYIIEGHCVVHDIS
jgi:hypothetical protein